MFLSPEQRQLMKNIVSFDGEEYRSKSAINTQEIFNKEQ